MDVFDLAAKITLDKSEYDKGLDDAGSKMSGLGGKLGSLGSKIASGIGTAMKVGAAAVSVAGGAVATFTKQAVSSFADYEQLVGGVETLFGDAADYVQRRASAAFETAGLSANEYMETVTSFSASLLQSLGGDTEKAAKVADQAIIDMADNANKMGSSMESIQNAYQGFAKQNYTMLDNLKLGYGGTKEEMQRLLNDAGKLAGTKFELGNYSDVIEAIHVIQENMGIAGTTAEEAASTISGSMAMMKSAWQNTLTAIGKGDMTVISETIGDLVYSAQTFANNVMPVVQRALTGIAQLIQELAPMIAAELPGLVANVLPPIIDAAVQIVDALAKGLTDALPAVVSTLTAALPTIIDTFMTILPKILEVGLDLIMELAKGIVQALPSLMPKIVDIILQITDWLLDNIDMVIDVGIEMIMAIAEGLIEALPRLIEKAPEIVIKLTTAIIKNLPKILQAGIELILMLVKGIVDSFGKLITAGAEIVEKVKSGFSDKVKEAKTWGRDMIQNFIDGILAKWNDLKASVSKVASTVKSYLGFSEPEEGPLSNFHTFAPDMMKLFAKGINDNMRLVSDAVNNTALSMAGGFTSNVSSTPTVSSSTSGIESILAQYLSEIKDIKLYLDTGALVGGTVNAYNDALGVISSRGSRR